MKRPFRLAGVVGYPIAHSVSPLLHSFWLKACGISGAYVPLPAAAEDFSAVVEGTRRSGFRGLNVTVPHKQSAHALADVVDEDARLTGAANVLLFSKGPIEARNTDVGGLAESLHEEFGADACRDRIAVLVGAGGAARAAVLSLARSGASEIRVTSRDGSAAHLLAAEFRNRVQQNLRPFAWSEWPAAVAGAGILINASSGGMVGGSPLELSLDPLPGDALVYDLVYNPLETPLLREARRRGHRAANGLGMLIHQAVPAFEAFYGSVPDDLRGARAELERALSC